MKYSDDQHKDKKGGISSPSAANWDTLEHAEEAYGWSISFPYTEKYTRPVDYIFNQIAIEAMSKEFEEDSDDDYDDE